MTIESALERQGWRLEKRSQWITINDERKAFRSAFSTYRIGKLIGSKFYVVPQDLHSAVERHILALGLTVERVASTNGRGREYLGFESAGQPDGTLLAFVELLYGEVQSRVQK